jgi:hypothetical protein
MNFKTTIVLLVALAVVGGVFWYSQLSEKKAPDQAADQATAGGGRKLLDLQSDQVSGFTITDSDGNHTTLEKSGAAWRMTEPVSAAAVDWQTQDLIRNLCDLRSQGRPASAPSDAGLDKPKYSIALSTSDGKTVRLDIGNRNFTGDLMFARVDDGEVNLIDSSLAKTLKTAADDLRDKHLLTANSLNVQQVRIITATQRLVLNKAGSKWKIQEPVEMPGDSEAVSSLISTIIGTEASEFVKPDSDDLAFARFDHPTMQVWLSAEAPSSQPTTAPSGGQTLTIGAPDSLTKDHYFVRTGDGLVAKIAASSLDNLKKIPLDLRDKDVVTILPEDVNAISLVKETYSAPTTQSSSVAKPQTQTVALARRPKESPQPLGPALPPNLKAGARPTAAPPATAPATQPAQSLWIFAAPHQTAQPVDDSKVDALLEKFNTLRADKYLEKNPNSPPQQRYLVSLETKMQRYQVEFVRPSNGQSAYGIYDDLKFEIPTALLDALDADFHKGGP